MKKNSKNKRGIAEVIVVFSVLVVLVLAALAYWYYSTNGQLLMKGQTQEEVMEYDAEPVVSMEPVSESTDSATLEEEVAATLEGSFEDDLLLMEKDASSL